MTKKKTFSWSPAQVAAAADFNAKLADGFKIKALTVSSTKVIEDSDDHVVLQVPVSATGSVVDPDNWDMPDNWPLAEPAEWEKFSAIIKVSNKQTLLDHFLNQRHWRVVEKYSWLMSA
jgi:hypothetical protein